MSWFSSLFDQSFLMETFLYIMAPSAIIAVIILNLVVVYKDKKIKQLQKSLQSLQKTYDELDNQAKLIIKTDLELHKTQSELDKKITGLYTLQKISHKLSTTLDENEIFDKITEEYLTELGFDKAISFLVNPEKLSSISTDAEIKLKIGYSEKEANEIIASNFTKEIFEPVIKQAEII